MLILKTNAIGNCANSKVHYGFANTMNSSKQRFSYSTFFKYPPVFYAHTPATCRSHVNFFTAVCCFRFKKEIIGLSGKYHKLSFGWLFIQTLLYFTCFLHELHVQILQRSKSRVYMGAPPKRKFKEYYGINSL